MSLGCKVIAAVLLGALCLGAAAQADSRASAGAAHPAAARKLLQDFSSIIGRRGCNYVVGRGPNR